MILVKYFSKSLISGKLFLTIFYKDIKIMINISCRKIALLMPLFEQGLKLNGCYHVEQM